MYFIILLTQNLWHFYFRTTSRTCAYDFRYEYTYSNFNASILTFCIEFLLHLRCLPYHFFAETWDLFSCAVKCYDTHVDMTIAKRSTVYINITHVNIKVLTYLDVQWQNTLIFWVFKIHWKISVERTHLETCSIVSYDVRIFNFSTIDGLYSIVYTIAITIFQMKSK